MHTIKLRVNDNAFAEILGLLSRYSKDQVEILPEEQDFFATQQYLQNELNEIDSGNAVFLTQEQLENRMEKIIQKYEDHI